MLVSPRPLPPYASAPPVRVVAAVIERDARVLIALRPLSKRHGGLWEFPGGKVEGEETDGDALRRELAEELGLRLVSTATPLAELQDAGSPFVIVFIPVVTDGEPECREHQSIRWASWNELPLLPLAPTDRHFAVARQ